MLFREKINYVYIAFFIFVMVVWASWFVRKSRMGHYLIAIREREEAAKAVGIATANMKIWAAVISAMRSEEHTSELQSLMRISYAVFCLNKKKTTLIKKEYTTHKHCQK